MNCPNCKKEVSTSDRYCTYCGCDLSSLKGGEKKLLLPILLMVLSVVILASGFGIYFGYHSWTEATCDNPATCKICKITNGEALGHNMTGATCTEASVCLNCGIEATPALGHTWAPATCTLPETCSVCSETQGAALGHTWPTGTTTSVEHCSVCDQVNGIITVLDESAWDDKDSGKRHGYKMKNGATVQGYIYEMDAPIESCVGLNAGVWLTGVTTGDPHGEWALLLRTSDGKWVEAATFVVDEDFDTSTVKWADPIDFDAWVMVPMDLGYTYNFGVIPSITQIQVFEYSADV